MQASTSTHAHECARTHMHVHARLQALLDHAGLPPPSLRRACGLAGSGSGGGSSGGFCGGDVGDGADSPDNDSTSIDSGLVGQVQRSRQRQQLQPSQSRHACVIVVHGCHDVVIPLKHSEQLVANRWVLKLRLLRITTASTTFLLLLLLPMLLR